MGSAMFIIDFGLWYYTRGFIDVLSVWFNFMWFITHYFSIPLLLRTLFSPWKRMTDDGRPRSIEAFMEAFIMNTMSRVFGAFVRLVIIFVGLITLCLGVVALGTVFAFWILAPFLLAYSFFYGIALLA
ncbi:hypothetical protein IPH92_01925 [Candidatus Kaiserbacteria bacterium]|nr:MAG: hypothetical protein IPH92_01925 [Candidatus Kaiserbacteria bacterium]